MTGKMMHNPRATCGCAFKCCNDPIDKGTLRNREKRRWRKEEW